MDRINRILEHPTFQECLYFNEMAEANRSFCHHDMEHILAVARIAMLINLEEKTDIPKDIVYAAALLHDCGRYKQYEDSTPHEKASALLAKEILPDCGYSEEEIIWIEAAILSHRGSMKKTREDVLADILYRADKMSRNCLFCKAYQECNWSKGLKEQKLVY